MTPKQPRPHSCSNTDSHDQKPPHTPPRSCPSGLAQSHVLTETAPSGSDFNTPGLSVGRKELLFTPEDEAFSSDHTVTDFQSVGVPLNIHRISLYPPKKKKTLTLAVFCPPSRWH
ncbi:hypothetical protein FQA47_009944 [Oryzias melastigma]|uniref:Uncharacterized protein n=1 Tax=Oryzias melastigma TaxID=30732 RepID=A0A834CNS5_ORYME|nr:hypothetical protein FQA47_009944 [Oryzias melastigma]